ncbi:hypothetical protein HanPSC8_Chr06g0242361 [Helianthus annuus]|nr:hypothetical protein HanPSC8_Chr06g0242361 [Helianthus annuus]
MVVEDEAVTIKVVFVGSSWLLTFPTIEVVGDDLGSILANRWPLPAAQNRWPEVCFFIFITRLFNIVEVSLC